MVGNKTEVGTYVKLSINNVSSEREGELLNGCSIYLYCLKGFSVSSISNSPGAISCCNLYIFLFISRNHLTQRVSTLFPGPLVSSIRPSIRQNWTSLSKSNNKKLWKTYLVWSWTIFEDYLCIQWTDPQHLMLTKGPITTVDSFEKPLLSTLKCDKWGILVNMVMMQNW